MAETVEKDVVKWVVRQNRHDDWIAGDNGVAEAIHSWQEISFNGRFFKSFYLTYNLFVI